MTENLISDILKDWTEFTKPEDESCIKLNSWDYTFRRYNEKIAKLVEQYNVPSEITVIYLKNLFKWYLEKAYVSLSDLLNKSLDISCIRSLYGHFNGEQIKEFENAFYDALSYISVKLSGDRLIGEIDFSKLVENSLDAIFDGLCKCHLEIYQKGGTVGKIENVSGDIYVFNTLVECLSVLQSYPDALYVCYISNHGTSDGYYGFFVKNNGNVFSVNERVREAFIGQHQHGRNHRFVNEKPEGIFPYELMEFSNYDYKGYARTYTLKNKDDRKVSLADLSQQSYITLLISILMIRCKVEGVILEEDVVYSNFYLSKNIQTLQNSGENELMVISDNQLIKAGENVLSCMVSKLTTESVLSGEMNDAFDRKVHPELKYYECGEFGNNLFVELYGQDFVFRPENVLIDSSIKLLSDKDAVINAEFVGNERELSLQIYSEARRQLAEHIKKKMNEEHEAFKAEFGCASEWWENRLNANAERVKRFVVQEYVNARNAEKLTHGSNWRRCDSKISVSYEEINFKHYFDFYNNKPCNCEITVKLTDWEDIQEILGEDIPKIIKGYTCKNRYRSNSNLDVVDPVLKIQTPFEAYGSFCYNADRFTFPIRLYFSKSGLKKYIKDNNITPEE